MDTRLVSRLAALLVLLAGAFPLSAQVPQLINYQGRVAVGGGAHVFTLVPAVVAELARLAPDARILK